MAENICPTLNLGTVTVDIVPTPDVPRTDNLEITVQVCDAAQKAAGKNGCDYNFTIPGRDVDDPGRALHISLATS